jgi:glycosyltransferase involved in cell wall biosynthesis
VLVAPVARELGIPLLVSFYGYDVSQVLEEAFWRRKYNFLWEMVDVSIVLSREMRNRLVQAACPVEKVEIVHLSSDFENLHFCRPSRPVQRLLFVGRLVEKKAPLDAVRAVDRVVSQGEDLSLHIVGDGSLRNEVSQYVATHDLDEHVTLHGALPHEDVLHQMEKADAFVLPSKTASTGDREGTPTVLVEAQASGLPCIATEHAGIPEMIPEANQDLLLPEGDPDALADRLRKLMALSVEELGKIAERGRGKVEADFCLSSEVEKLKNIYWDVIQ